MRRCGNVLESRPKIPPSSAESFVRPSPIISSNSTIPTRVLGRGDTFRIGRNHRCDGKSWPWKPTVPSPKIETHSQPQDRDGAIYTHENESVRSAKGDGAHRRTIPSESQCSATLAAPERRCPRLHFRDSLEKVILTVSQKNSSAVKKTILWSSLVFFSRGVLQALQGVP